MLSTQEIRQIAKEAFIYGFPMVASYQTLYKQCVDDHGPDHRGPMNTLGRSTGVATPDDKFVVTPNSDTPYSYLWMDLRAEPMVVTMPRISKDRSYSGQLIDLYTYNFAYLGSRAYGNEGGTFLIAGPEWTGDTPVGVKAVMRAETEFAYLLFRTQLFNAADWDNVKKIQDSYSAKPLSKYLGTPPPFSAAPVRWPELTQDMLSSPALFNYLNFLLQYCPVHPSERALMARFALLDIGADKVFDIARLSADARAAVNDGIGDAWNDFSGLQKRINAEEVQSTAVFGTRDFLKGNYLYRFGAAKLGLYGNTGAEAVYFAYFVDANNHPLDSSKESYQLSFSKDALPPAKAFWSLTMYDAKSQLLVANPLRRYLLNSTMLKEFKYGEDGSLTFRIQKEPPAEEQSNWLPAPDGAFYAVLRLYLPAPEVVNGSWTKPAMKSATIAAHAAA